MFADNSQDEIYPLCDFEGVTSLELAYTIKAISPVALEIKFSQT